jgi:hypothetical protein
MRNKFQIFILFCAFLSLILLCSCGKSGNTASKAVENYINALVSKDADMIATLSCGTWEANARTEVDSFMAVKVRAENLSCQETGSEGDTTYVICQGKLIATYNNEDQELDLSLRTYKVTNQNGEYLICGYK